MALPVIETQSYELTLPSADVKVKFRPFLVKEEKVLLQALESQEQKQIVNALKDIVNACTFGTLNVDDLPTFDWPKIEITVPWSIRPFNNGVAVFSHDNSPASSYSFSISFSIIKVGFGLSIMKLTRSGDKAIADNAPLALA